MRFGAAAVLVIAIGVAIASWPNHHVATQPQAAFADPTLAPASPSPTPSPLATPTGLGSSLARSTQSSARSAGSLEAAAAFHGPIVILTGWARSTPPSTNPSSPAN